MYIIITLNFLDACDAIAYLSLVKFYEMTVTLM